MREVIFLASISIVLSLCLTCGCERKPIIKSEIENPLADKRFNLAVAEESLSQISRVYYKFYSGMPVKNAVAVAGIPDSVMKDIKFLKNFNIPKKGYALVYYSPDFNAYAIVDPNNDRILKVIYEIINTNTAFEYTAGKPAATVFDVKKGMTEEEMVALIGKPDKTVDGARDLSKYPDPENYFRLLYKIDHGSHGSQPFKWIEFEFSKTDRKIIEIYQQ